MSILDHVENVVSRASKMEGMEGTNIFLSKQFREIYSSDGKETYNLKNNDRIKFMLSSADKLDMIDMRSGYLKFDCAIRIPANKLLTDCGVAEPITNLFNRLVIRINGVSVEDINLQDNLNSFVLRSLNSRAWKNSHPEQWAWKNQVYRNVGVPANKSVVSPCGTEVDFSRDAATGLHNGRIPGPGAGAAVAGDVPNDTTEVRQFCCTFPLSGILNHSLLLSMYYMPIEIQLWTNEVAKVSVCAAAGDLNTDVFIYRPRYCANVITVSPLYMAAFEESMLQKSNAEGLKLPYETWYNEMKDINTTGSDVFYMRHPVRYLNKAFLGFVDASTEENNEDSYNYIRGKSNTNAGVSAVQLSLGSYNFRRIEEIDSSAWNSNTNQGLEKKVLYEQAVNRYQDLHETSNEFAAVRDANLLPARDSHYANYGFGLQMDPDAEYVSGQSTLQGADIRWTISGKKGEGGAAACGLRAYGMLQYQCSLALYPGNVVNVLQS